MIIRIVKMSFEENQLKQFFDHFNKHKEKIRNYKGCRLLEIYQDKDQPSIVFSYSHWESTDHLENYRNSQMFKDIWKATKVMFNDKPEAWTVDKIYPV